MIPRHRPPFGIVSLLKHGLVPSKSDGVAELELRCADSLDVADAVWLPSARYGICKSLQHGLEVDATVCTPAFTCRVVHEAVRRSGRRPRLLDCARDGFLMNVRTAASAADKHGIVLSEIFGHRFRETLESPLVRGARLRIFDMAMAIPARADLRRLRDKDVAVVSFGLGKALYSGWGGMAFTNDRGMADVLRSSRDRDLERHRLSRMIAHAADVFLRVAAHHSAVYGALRRLNESRRQHGQSNDVALADAESSSLPREWRHRPSGLSTKLTARNFRNAADFDQRRRELADIYHENLASLSGLSLQLPPREDRGLSHFSIRVSATERDPLRRHLLSLGIDTATLFPFPADCRKTDFPRTARLCAEIVNLPLSHQLTSNQVIRICEALQSFEFSRKSHRAAA